MPDRIPTLIICTAGICISYLIYGLIQERLYLYRSPDDGASFQYTTFLMFSQAITNTIAAKFGIWMKRKINSRNNNHQNINRRPFNVKLVFINALFYAIAMTASNESLRYVSYPTQSLAKSCKLVPTMIMGVLVEKRKYSVHQWVGTFFITAGIVIFNLNNIKRDDKTSSTYGLCLVGLSLIMDGLNSSYQGLVKVSDPKKYRILGASESMLWINTFAITFFFPVAVISGQFFTAIKFFSRNSEALTAILYLNLMAAIGQHFIFLTIVSFSSLVCTTITTVRKFMTIILSVAVFGHSFSWSQWCSVASVFFGIFLETSWKKTEQKVIKVY
mmetsp:Transcript_19172/g.43654  ORF Transcript_19172/g.43654 Transcript_19172/m.43654 type:complete len:330 (+) Transcript_19172:525-1514(+)